MTPNKHKNQKCEHKNTKAFSDPLNSYFGVCYKCTDCGEIVDINELMKNNDTK